MINDKVVKTAFIISFVGHCLFLGMPGFNLYTHQTKKPEEITVRIDIEKLALLPKIDVIGDEKKLKEVIGEKKPLPPESETEVQPDQIVIEELPKEPEEKVEVIDPVQQAMLRYQDVVKQRIEEVRRYPVRAKQNGIEGNVNLNFVILSNGLSKDTKIISSSGFRILDDEAVATVTRASPCPSISKELHRDFVSIEVTIVFKME